jgi:hypothetical protein
MAPKLRLSLAIAGTALFAAVATAAIGRSTSPKRYRADLDPPKLQPAKIQPGRQTGWYVYLYMDGARVVCTNPFVWDGPRVITCDQVVTIDSDERQVPTARIEQAAPVPGPENPFFVPTYPDQDAALEEIDLLHKRLSFKTRNAERRR